MQRSCDGFTPGKLPDIGAISHYAWTRPETFLMRYLLALDQGTTSSRAIIFDAHGNAVRTEQMEYRQIYPCSGWVEHDPLEIWRTQLQVAQKVLRAQGLGARDIAAIGIANQRETTLLWDRNTGEPIGNAIVWQDRRTAAHCETLHAQGSEGLVRSRTGLLLDPYFAATKIAWLLQHMPGARVRAEAGELAFGTVDSWLLWQLTAGRSEERRAGKEWCSRWCPYESREDE